MQTPYFSVVICTYNRAKYLSLTLESIAFQNYPSDKFEVVIVDNNSPDDTESVCTIFSEKYNHLKIKYYKELQQGISFGRNRGVQEAEGEFIAFIDDDETIKADYLDNLEQFFRKHLDASLCAGPVVPVYETEKPIWLSKYTLRLITGSYDKGHEVKVVKGKDYPGTGHATFRKNLFIQFGGFNTKLGRKGTSLMGAEDKDFFLRLIQNNVKCYYVPTAVIYHHIPESKLSESFFNRLTYSIGASERIRTLSESKLTYLKKIFITEGIKWCASIFLFFVYLIKLEYPKGIKLIKFRYNVARGLLNKHPNELTK